jgi:imidazoleglycerol-phosphate dehydratase
MSRQVEVERNTNETNIHAELNLDGKGDHNIFTGVSFFDHMLTQVAKHGGFDIFLNAKGDVDVDCHHTVEDVGIVLGKAVLEALGGKTGINRYGNALIPMEDALILCAVDVCGRPYLSFDVEFTKGMLGTLDTEMIKEFFRSFCVNGGIAMHIKQLSGTNNHHIAEGVFKAFARAMKDAVKIVGDGIPSTKGVL